MKGSLVSRNSSGEVHVVTDWTIAFHLLATRHIAQQDHGKKDLKRTIRFMQDLIEAGADLQAPDHKGNTALHEAFGSKQLVWDVRRILNVPVTAMVNLGAPITALNHQGQTILHLAAATEEDSLQQGMQLSPSSRIDFCLRKDWGLDVNARDHEGTTPLHLAAASSEISACKLMQYGADVQARTGRGLTPLHFAAKAGNCNVVDILVRYYEANSLSLDCQDLRGQTPLHEAARSGRPESVSILLAARASCTILDKRGRTALHASAEFEELSVARRAQHADYAKDPLAQDDDFGARTYRIPYKNPLDSMESVTKAGSNPKCIREVVKLLLNAGIDVGQLDNNDHTANDVAVMLGNAAVVQELADTMATLYSTHETISPLSTLQPLDPIGELLLSGAGRTSRKAIEKYFGDNSVQLLERIISYGDDRLLEELVNQDMFYKQSSPDWLVRLDGRSPALHLLAECGLASMMKTLLPFVKDIHAIKPPLLHVAVQRSLWNIEMIHVLLQHGAEVNAQYLDPLFGPHLRSDQYAAIHILAGGYHSWHPRALQVLLQAGADPEIINGDGETALQIALASRSPTSYSEGFWCDQILDVLLEHGANVNLIASATKLTPLNTALECHAGPKTIQKLLDHGADGSFGPKPAIASAIDGQDIACLELLLKAGADPNQVYMSNQVKRHEEEARLETALQNVACNISRYNCDPKYDPSNDDQGTAAISLLIAHGANPNLKLKDGASSVLHEIASLNGLIKPMLIDGVNLEERDENGCTPLIRSCDLPEAYKRVIMQDYAALELIKAGADIYAMDNTGSTALHYAVKSGLTQTSKKLLEKGLSPNVKDNTGTAPLFYSFESKRFQDIVNLLDAGADPLQTAPDGRTLLHCIAPNLMQYSCAYPPEGPQPPLNPGDLDEFLEYTKLNARCIEAGCDRETRDDNGNTPIFAYVGAVKDYDYMDLDYPPDEKDIRKMLQEHDVHVVNHDGDTLLHVVAGRDEDLYHQQDGLVLFNMLVEMGLDPKRENKSGATPVDVAAACGNQEILKLFARDE
jgi:ankyrin repeat protein